MNQEQLRALFEQVRAGEMDIDGAVDRLRHLPFEDLGFAKVDHHRALRHGMPEVIFAKGKTPEQVVAIAECLLARSANVLITRADRACADLVTATLPDAEYLKHVTADHLRDWYREKDLLPDGLESVIDAASTLDDTIQQILCESGLDQVLPIDR